MVYGLTMFRSLAECGMEFELYVLCLSDNAFDMLEGIDPRLIPVKLGELEQYDPELKSCKNTRSRTEYIFTMSPCLPLFLFHKFPQLKMLTYLDSDLCFFDSPECLFKELGERSLYIIEHRFAPGFEKDILNGRFNMAFQIYRNNEVGIACLKKWRNECLEWCYDRCEDGKFADQKYLDSWPELWGEEVVVSAHPGANLAPWNIGNFAVKTEKSKVTVNGCPLIFVHYQSFKLVSRTCAVWVSWSRNKKIRKTWHILPKLYLRELQKTMQTYPELFGDWKPLFSFRGTAPGVRESKVLAWIPGAFFKQIVHIVYSIWHWRHGIYFIPEK